MSDVKQNEPPPTVPARTDDVADGHIWLDTAIAACFVALPSPMATLAMNVAFRIAKWREDLAGLPDTLPSRLEMHDTELLVYATTSTVSVALVWFWASKHRLRNAIFKFCPMTRLDVLVVFSVFTLDFFAAPFIKFFISSLRGNTAPLAAFIVSSLRVYHAHSLELVCVLAVGPLTEEVLFRGLLVSWLRVLRWPTWLIFVFGSVGFAAIHVPQYGLAWAVYTAFFAATAIALRLWRNSLTPSWLIHIMLNTSSPIILPTIYSLVRVIG